MIFFKAELNYKALKLIKESHDLLDVATDLDKIDQAQNNIDRYAMDYQKSPNEVSLANYQTSLYNANNLDEELRKKYPTIDLMLNIANDLPKITFARSSGNAVVKPQEYRALSQDRCGIKCHVLIKKEIISHAEQFIDHVEPD